MKKSDELKQMEIKEKEGKKIEKLIKKGEMDLEVSEEKS